MALSEPWSIKSRAHRCSITDIQFTDGQAFYTAIFPDLDPSNDASGYLRKDFSLDGWENRPDTEQTPFSFWQSVYEVPEKTEDVQVTNESPEDLLRRLIKEDEDHTENARYILAIMLERKKSLKEADSQSISDGTIRIYEQRKTGEIFIIKDPNIALDDIALVQKEIADLLENGGRQTDPEEQKDTPSL